MGTRWVYYGNTMGLLWEHDGNTMGTRCVYYVDKGVDMGLLMRGNGLAAIVGGCVEAYDRWDRIRCRSLDISLARELLYRGDVYELIALGLSRDSVCSMYVSDHLGIGLERLKELEGVVYGIESFQLGLEVKLKSIGDVADNWEDSYVILRNGIKRIVADGDSLLAYRINLLDAYGFGDMDEDSLLGVGDIFGKFWKRWYGYCMDRRDCMVGLLGKGLGKCLGDDSKWGEGVISGRSSMDWMEAWSLELCVIYGDIHEDIDISGGGRVLFKKLYSYVEALGSYKGVIRSVMEHMYSLEDSPSKCLRYNWYSGLVSLLWLSLRHEFLYGLVKKV